MLNSAVAGSVWVQEEVLPPDLPLPRVVPKGLLAFPLDTQPEQLQRAEGSEQSTHWLQQLFHSPNVHQQYTD